MISEFFVNLYTTLVGWIAGMLGEWTPPPELLDAATQLNALVESFAGMGAWIAWPVLAGCVSVAVATWAIVLGIKLVRALLAHIPAFGGAGD